MKLTHTKGKQPAIGVFDSGIGGVSVLHEIRQLMPSVNLIYVADSAWLPYGNKPESVIRKRAELICDFLIKQGASIIVVACNTATASAVAHLREKFHVPIVGMEPAIKPAAHYTNSGVVAVLATENTTKSHRLASLKDRFAHDIELLVQPCHGLVELVEANKLNTPETVAMLEGYIKPLLDAKADVLILGCTHYPFLKPAIQSVAGEEVTILDTGLAIARHVKRQMQSLNLQHEHEAHEYFYCTGNAEIASMLLANLWLHERSFVMLAI